MCLGLIEICGSSLSHHFDATLVVVLGHEEILDGIVDLDVVKGFETLVLQSLEFQLGILLGLLDDLPALSSSRSEDEQCHYG